MYIGFERDLWNFDQIKEKRQNIDQNLRDYDPYIWGDQTPWEIFSESLKNVKEILVIFHQKLDTFDQNIARFWPTSLYEFW